MYGEYLFFYHYDEPLKESKPPKKEDLEGLPEGYNEDKLVFMVWDPFWGYAYWEIKKETYENACLLCEKEVSFTMRVYNITYRDYIGKGEYNYFFDIEIGNRRIGSWYIDLGKPDNVFILEIGVKTDNGFYTILRSNIDKTPRNSFSDFANEYAKEIGEKLYKDISLKTDTPYPI